MKILRNYMFRECILPFVLSLGVLTCIFLLGNLIRLANLVINKGVSLAAVGKMFLYYIPFLLGYTLPIACLTTVILAFSRLSTDNEVLAMRASGIHLRKLLFPLSIVALIVSLFAIILNERIIPYAHHEQRKILKNIGSKNPSAFLEAGTFIHEFEGQIIFIYRIEGNKLYNVRIYQPQSGNKPTRTIIANEGEFTPVPGENKIKLKLINGTSDEPNFENPNSFYKLNFKNYFMTLDLSASDKKIEKKPKSMSLQELQDKIKSLKHLDVDTFPLITEYHRKISWSFSIFFFVVLGFPLAVITHRREKSINAIIAILCGAFYYLLSLGCEALSVQNITPPAITMWMPNIITGLIALFLNFRVCRL